MQNKNYYITTPIYYPSAKPHMGHAYSSIIADFFARFKRLDGYDVYFLTGTDEHGLKIQKAATENKLSPKAFCDKISQTFKDLFKLLNLSNDDFIRTTEARHLKSVQFLWNKLYKNGEIYLSKYKGWYSVSDEAFYNEDEVETKENQKISTVSMEALLSLVKMVSHHRSDRSWRAIHQWKCHDFSREWASVRLARFLRRHRCSD